MNTAGQRLGDAKRVEENLDIISYGIFLWESELKIVLSAKIKKKCCIVVDIKAWKIGYIIVGNVWPISSQDMKKRINMVELGKARRTKFDLCKNN